MRTFACLTLLALLACSTGRAAVPTKDDPAPPRPVGAPAAGPVTAEPAATAGAGGPAAAPEAGGPMRAPGPERGAPPPGPEALPAADADNSPCQTVDDCTTTYFASGACCPMLCSPRAVTRKAAAAQMKEVMQCQNLKACAHPLCRPPPFERQLACVEGRCLNRRVAGLPAEVR